MLHSIGKEAIRILQKVFTCIVLNVDNPALTADVSLFQDFALLPKLLLNCVIS
jgi:hypothetical protein